MRMRFCAVALTLWWVAGCQLNLGTGANSNQSSDGWTRSALVWTAKAPEGARVGTPVTLAASAAIGSGSCARFVSAEAKADEATRTVRLSGFKETAPSGRPCTKDFRSESPPLSFTPRTAGTWTLEAPGLEAPITFEVLAEGAVVAASPSPLSASRLAGQWAALMPNQTKVYVGDGDEVAVPATGPATVAACTRPNGIYTLEQTGNAVTLTFANQYRGGAAPPPGMSLGGYAIARGTLTDGLLTLIEEPQALEPFNRPWDESGATAPVASPTPQPAPKKVRLTFDPVTQHLVGEWCGSALHLVPFIVATPASPCPPVQQAP